jgi:hypothetical protein
MNANSFTLEFGHKNVLVRFSQDEKVKVHVVDQPFKSKSIANALTAMMIGYYPVQEDGLYMHKTLEEVYQSLGDKNVGYATGKKLVEMVASGLVSRNKEVSPIGIYRLLWDGFRLSAAELVYREYADDEPMYASHDRKARAMIENLEWLKRAFAMGVNVRLLYTEADEVLFAEKMEQYQLFIAGDLEGLKARVNEGVANAQTYNTMKHYVNLAEKAAGKNTPFEIKKDFVVCTLDGQELEPSALIGETIQFAMGMTVMNKPYIVDEANLSSVIATLKARNLKVVIATPVIA